MYTDICIKVIYQLKRFRDYGSAILKKRTLRKANVLFIYQVLRFYYLCTGWENVIIVTAIKELIDFLDSNIS